MIPQTLTVLLIITFFTQSGADSCRCVSNIEPRDPVCCNGEDFPNYCGACNEGGFTNQNDCTEGACSSCRCVASLDPVDPVCCDGEYEYINLCAACNEGGFTNANSDCQRGSCDCLSDCVNNEDIDHPICCEDTTYTNSCEARCVYSLLQYVIKCARGACESDTVVEAEAATDANNDDVDADDPVMVGPSCTCTAQYDPVCCEDTLYSNECKAKCVYTSVRRYNDNCATGMCPVEADELEGIFDAVDMSVTQSQSYLKWSNWYLLMVFAVVIVGFIITKGYGRYYGGNKRESEPLMMAGSDYGAI